MTKNSTKGSVRNICPNLIHPRLRLAGIQVTVAKSKYFMEFEPDLSDLGLADFGMPITVANPEEWTIGSFYSLQPSHYKLYVMSKVKYSHGVHEHKYYEDMSFHGVSFLFFSQNHAVAVLN